MLTTAIGRAALFRLLRRSYGKGAFVRLIFCSQTTVFVGTGMLEHETLLYRITATAGEVGVWTHYAILFLALVGLFDNLVNDYSRWSCAWLESQRHFIYMGLAFCYALLASFAVGVGRPSILPYYLLSSVLLVAGAFYDVRVRCIAVYLCKKKESG